MKRHLDAGVYPSTVLYVDRDSRRGIAVETKRLLSQWSEMEISLDIWHFMRCIAVGCTTQSQPKYAIFLGRLFHCTFVWSQEDLKPLIPATHCKVTTNGVKDPSEEDFIKKSAKKSLRPIATGKSLVWKKPTYLIHDLIDTFQDEQGGDTLGVPLLNANQIWDIWDSQNSHIACIQDPDEVQLYIKTGVVTKGGVELPLYRCTQGSTSLKSYHIYHNRFIPGICTCTVDVEIYFNYWMDINWLVITFFCFWNGSMGEKCCKWERADIDECPYC